MIRSHADFPVRALPDRLLAGLGALAAAAVFALCLAQQAAAGEGAVFTKDGVALGGTDPVAYFSMGKPVQGSPEFTAEYEGATWRFASAEHRDLFVGDPEKYAPQYGGFCAFGVAVPKYKIETVPEAWSIVDGKLYLNYTVATRKRWERDIPGHIAAADETWPQIESD